MNDKLVDLFIDFARQKKRWPLLFLIPIPPWFWSLLQFYGTTFRETFSVWLFSFGCGILLILAGPSVPTSLRQQ